MATTPWSALIKIVQRLLPHAPTGLERWALGAFLASGLAGTRVRNSHYGVCRSPAATPP